MSNKGRHKASRRKRKYSRSERRMTQQAQCLYCAHRRDAKASSKPDFCKVKNTTIDKVGSNCQVFKPGSVSRGMFIGTDGSFEVK